jgi:iron complex outermembrane receptor protein
MNRTLPACLLVLATAASAAARAADEQVLKEVTVTSTGLSDVDERRQAATQKVIIDRAEIEKMGALTINDVLGKLPGIDIGTPTADGTVAMRSRGMTRDSVQLVVDGERIPPGHNRMIQGTVGRLPSGELRQIEIIRGSSAEFGGSAPVTVHLLLAKPMARESTEAKLAAGERGGRPVVQANYSKGGGDKGFSWLLPFTFNHNETPANRRLRRSDDAGTLQEDHVTGYHASDSLSFSPRLTWKSGRDSFTLHPLLFGSYGSGSSDFLRRDLAQPGNDYARQDEDTLRRSYYRLRANAEAVRQDVKYSARASVATSERDSTTRRLNLATGSVTEEQGQRDALDTDVAVRIDWSAGKHLLAANLGHVGHSSDESLLSTQYAPESHESWERQWSAWLQDEWSPNAATTYTLGLRGEFLRYAVDGARQAHDKWLPSLAVRWEPAPQWVLRSSLGAGLKTPRLDELTNQPVRSVNANTPLEPDQRGNPALRPERSVNLEAVLERYLPNDAGVFGANVYLRHTQDFIERRVALEGVRWVERPYNEGAARHWGVELDGKLRTDSLGWRGATFRVHLTVPRSRVEDERLGITRAAREMPRYTLSAGYDQTLAETSLGVSLQHSGRVLTEVEGEQYYATRRRTLVDAYILRRLDRNLNLRLSAQNLFRADARRQQDAFSAGNTWSLATWERGARTVLLSLEGKW